MKAGACVASNYTICTTFQTLITQCMSLSYTFLAGYTVLARSEVAQLETAELFRKRSQEYYQDAMHIIREGLLNGVHVVVEDVLVNPMGGQDDPKLALKFALKSMRELQGYLAACLETIRNVVITKIGIALFDKFQLRIYEDTCRLNNL